MLKTTHPQIISTIDPLWWKAHYGRLSVTFWRPTMALSNILGMFINWIGPYPDARNGQKYRHKRFVRIVRSSLQKMVLNSGEGRFDTSYIERAYVILTCIILPLWHIMYDSCQSPSCMLFFLIIFILLELTHADLLN